MSQSNGAVRRSRCERGESRLNSPQVVERWGADGEIRADSPAGGELTGEALEFVGGLYERVEGALRELAAVREALGALLGKAEKGRLKEEKERRKEAERTSNIERPTVNFKGEMTPLECERRVVDVIGGEEAEEEGTSNVERSKANVEGKEEEKSGARRKRVIDLPQLR